VLVGWFSVFQWPDAGVHGTAGVRMIALMTGLVAEFAMEDC